MIRDLSADAINDREENFADAIRARTSRHGVDIILDIMGGSYFGRNMGALASGRTVWPILSAGRCLPIITTSSRS